MSLSPGSRLGSYEVTALIGQGGMGVVHTAHDPRLDRQVAIKVLPPDLTQDETATQRITLPAFMHHRSGSGFQRLRCI